MTGAQPGDDAPLGGVGWSRAGVAWLVLAIGLIAAVVVSLAWADGQRRVAEARLSGRIAEAASGLSSRVDRIAEVASAVRGLDESSVNLTDTELRRFVDVLRGDRALQEQVPGLSGLLVVSPRGADLVVDDAFPSLVAETVSGIDVSRSRAAREALLRATDLGVAVTSEPIAEAARDDLRADLILAVPVYRDVAARSSTASLETRRRALKRWVVALIDVDDLLEGVAPSARGSVAFVAFDGRSVDAGTRLGSVPAGYELTGGAEGRRRTVVVNLRDTAWLLRVEAVDGFRGPFERAQAWIVLVAGVALAFLLFTLTSVLSSSRARALQMVDERTAELEQTNAELSRFTGVVSHDLKSPLTGVLGFLELLGRDSVDVGDQARGFVEAARSSAIRMNALIDRLLDYASAGTVVGRRAPVDLADALVCIESDLRVRLEERGGRLEIGDLPVVTGDGPRLEQVLQNLVGNAFKFVPGDRAPHVRVSARRQGETWVVTVADNGVGIAEEDREAVLRPFERTGRTAGYAGTGLGLAICVRILEAHGGALELDDSDLGGTAVRIVLPVVDPDDDTTSDAPAGEDDRAPVTVAVDARGPRRVALDLGGRSWPTAGDDEAPPESGAS